MRRLAFVLLSAIAACTSPPPQPRPADGLPPTGAPVDLVRIHKAARTLEVWSRGRSVLILTRIQLGHRPIGPKQFEGDGRTPEGRYLIDWRNPRSSYHLSLHVSYPDPRQVAAARTQGRSAGGMIMIHGQPNGRATRMSGDWTDGCIALSNQEIETLWDLVPDGAIIEILA
jgi:murein L,D-transpeptidase YafK